MAFIIATIRKRDYEAFRTFVGNDFPDTYDEWLYLADQKRTQAIRDGHIPNLVEVYPDELFAFCGATGANYTIVTLDLCATYKYNSS